LSLNEGKVTQIFYEMILLARIYSQPD
jgi:hypothetical protein